jgi:hypothetical protein
MLQLLMLPLVMLPLVMLPLPTLLLPMLQLLTLLPVMLLLVMLPRLPLLLMPLATQLPEVRRRTKARPPSKPSLKRSRLLSKLLRLPKPMKLLLLMLPLLVLLPMPLPLSITMPLTMPSMSILLPPLSVKPSQKSWNLKNVLLLTQRLKDAQLMSNWKSKVLSLPVFSLRCAEEGL